MKRMIPLLTSLVALPVAASAQQPPYDSSLGNLMRLSNARTRSITPENPTGEKGRGGMATLQEGSAAYAARELGQGWKVYPYVDVEAGDTYVLANIEGSGIIQHIWMTVTGDWRFSILRMRWDGEEHPSVEVPIGDFFAQGWGRYAHINSLPVSVNPGSGFNSFWQMPFRERAELTLTNVDTTRMRIYFQVTYAETEVPEDAAYFHAQFRRVNPLPYKDVFTIVDGIRGKGHYVGTYLAHGANSPGWWGEGEVKFYLDGDKDFPTIAGTGEEDYFLGSYSYISRHPDGVNRATDYTTLFAGYHQIVYPEANISQRRFGQYRWHIMDPIRFDEELTATIQSLGWQTGGRYLPLQDDLASVAFWYQTEPHNVFPAFPGRDELAISWTSPVNQLGRLGDIQLEHQPSTRYTSDARALLDGTLGTNAASAGNWVGIEGNDLVATIDLNMVRAIQRVAVRFLESQRECAFHPASVEFLTSPDGRTYDSVYRSSTDLVEGRPNQVRMFEQRLDHREARFVRVVARNIGTCPSWHSNAGSRAWVLADEIIIE